MNTSAAAIAPPATPAMREFRVANDLIGNRQALDAAWERDGYWFFRNVLDHAAIARLHAAYLGVLKAIGAIDGDAVYAIHNGSSLSEFPIARHDRLDQDPLCQLNPMTDFIADPAIHALFKQLIDDEPVWLPVTEYHASPPQQDRDRSRFNFIHRDSTTNPCIPFRICWIPLTTIDEEMGGLAMTEGLHRPRPGDSPPSPIPDSMPIPESAIPGDAWRRTTYRPGDLLMFDKDSPHSGLANYSQKQFRLSMDVRLMAAADKLPVVGSVAAVDTRSIAVRDASGKITALNFDTRTYCRDFGNIAPATLQEIPQRFGIGARVIVSSENGMARLIRPQR
jgi:ectoine hydroxylase-related dioxygenase (phytanoyl-CoA dioxygenase family)